MNGARLDVRPDRLDAEGKLKRESIRIGTPRAANCAACHGLVVDVGASVALPATLEAAPAPGRTWSLTRGGGAIVAPQRMSDSFLDLEGKELLTAPWDVHAAKLVDCVACHYARNSPARTDGKQGSLRYLTADPRRQTQAEFLVRPDHRLAEQDCRGCHDPMKAHAFLPYRERHMEVLSCTACHATGLMGPAAEMVDATVVTAAGGPSVQYRNVERRPGDTLNTATIRPLRPLLVERVESDGVRRVAPVNLVSRYRWVSRLDGADVPFETVARAWLAGGTHAPDVVAAFDVDRNGRIDEAELRLDTAQKTELIAGRLRTLGVEDPVVVGDLDVHPLAHGISTRDRALKNCNACHAEDSRLADDYLVASYLPGGSPPRPPDGARVVLAGVIAPSSTRGARPAAGPRGRARGLHVLGHSRQAWTNRIGFLSFLAVLLGVTVHGGLRYALRRKRSHLEHPAGEKEYVFGRYERLWHWTMALSGIVLIVTGLEVHGDREVGADDPSHLGGHPQRLRRHPHRERLPGALLPPDHRRHSQLHPPPEGLPGERPRAHDLPGARDLLRRVSPEERRRPEAESAAAGDLPGAAQRALPAPDRHRRAHLGGRQVAGRGQCRAADFTTSPRSTTWAPGCS